MSAIHIDTVQEFLSLRPLLQKHTVTSGTHGPIRVPCTTTLLVRGSLIVANSYNPNAVPEDRMELLRTSIVENGFCFPIVVIWDDDLEKFVIIDGFHRGLIAGPDWLDLDYIPVVVLDHNMAQRMAATIQFNKSRGVHQVDLDAEVIRALIEQGMSEEQISEHLGLDMETVHRYKQITGVAELFKGAAYSRSWSIVEDSDA